MKKDFETIALDIEGGIATVTLNRVDARNALNLQMCQDLLAVAKALAADKSVRVCFIRGAGPCFCAGADLKERPGKPAEWIRARRMASFAAYAAFDELEIPVIAVVHGAALGAGVEISAICDFIIATPDAFFGTPETVRGSVGATQRLPRAIGKRLAKDLMFTGRRMGAEEAKQAGFVSRIVPKEKIDEEVAQIGKTIVGATPDAVRLAKRCIDRGVELDPAGALKVEMEAIEEQLSSGKWMGNP